MEWGLVVRGGARDLWVGGDGSGLLDRRSLGGFWLALLQLFHLVAGGGGRPSRRRHGKCVAGGEQGRRLEEEDGGLGSGRGCGDWGGVVEVAGCGAQAWGGHTSNKSFSPWSASRNELLVDESNADAADGSFRFTCGSGPRQRRARGISGAC